jgi:hypothetical protein
MTEPLMRMSRITHVKDRTAHVTLCLGGKRNRVLSDCFVNCTFCLLSGILRQKQPNSELPDIDDTANVDSRQSAWNSASSEQRIVTASHSSSQTLQLCQLTAWSLRRLEPRLVLTMHSLWTMKSIQLSNVEVL